VQAAQMPMTVRRRWTIASILVVGVSVISIGPPLRGQSPASSIELISATPQGRPAGGQIPNSGEPYLYSRGAQKVSADSRYVVFASETSQDIGGDTLSFNDIFVRDRQTRTTRLVSRPGPGHLITGGNSGFPVISANGRYVAFISSGYNFGPVDTNEIADVYVADLVTDTIQLVSVTTSGVPSNVYPEWVTISADGRYIGFQTRSSTIIPGDGNRLNSDIFVRDMVLGTTQRVSVRSDGSEITGADSIMPSMSADGRRIAFTVWENTDAGPTPQLPANLDRGIYVRDLNTNQTLYVSEHPDGVPGRFHFQPLEPMISANGRYVTFASRDDLDPNFPDRDQEEDGPSDDIFVRDLQTSITSRVSLPYPGGPAEESGRFPTISADGRYVAYRASQGIRVRDRVAGTTTEIITAGVDGAPLNESILIFAISEDGQLVYFESGDANLVDPPDINVRNDSFVWRMGPSADLSLALSASTTQPAPNSTVTLTVAVTNNGPNDGSGVAVRVPLPAGLTFVSATGTGYNATAGTWTIGALTSGSTATLQIEATYTVSSAVTVTAQVSTATPRDPDSTPDNNNPSEDDQQSVVLAPNVADLSLDLQVNATQPPVGSNVTFTVSLTNGGPGTGTGIVGRMTLPAGLTFVSANPAAVYHAPSGFWTPPSLPSGATVTLTVVARVTVATPIDVIAQVAGVDQLDPDSTPNNDVATEDDQDTVRLTPVATGIVVNDASMAVNGNDGLCTLVEAIVAANTDQPSGNAVGECAGGNGPDTIHLRALNAPKDGANRDLYRVLTINNNDFGPSGLPVIVTDITIEGGSAIVQRGGVAAFRLFTVVDGASLTLSHVGVVGGLLTGSGSFQTNGAGVLNGGTLTLDNAYFASNQAIANGGAVASSGPVHVRASTFEFNVASLGSGGAIHAFFAGAVDIVGSTLRSNSAPAGSGGAVMIHGTTTASIVDSVIDANVARVEGGGLLMHNADANVSISNTRFTNNVVTDGNGGAISNGRVSSLNGLMIVLGGTMTVANSVVSNNRVTAGYAAGIANAGALTIASTTVSDNQVTDTRCGAGVYHTVGQATLNGATVTRNTGGVGVCALASGLSIANSTISFNSNPGGPGGGVYLGTSSATITGATILGNESSTGGGISSFTRVASTTLTVDSTVVQQNRVTLAGGGIAITGGTTTLRNNTRLIDNTAAGGGGGLATIPIGDPAILTMTGGAIEGNVANATSGGGGGIANYDPHVQSRLTLTDVVIRNNRAPNRDGGGVFSMGVLIMNRGELRGNTALSGAGLTSGLSETGQGGPTTLTNVTIEDNVASLFGGGIYNTASATAGSTMTVSGGTVRNNRAAIGGGIDNRATLLVDRMTLASNIASQEGGAIYNAGASTISTSTFSGNSALRGGGLRVAGGTANVTSSTLSGNSATADGAGALDVGTPVAGGLPQGRANLSWSTIAANVGSVGGIRNAGIVQILTSIVAANRRPDGTIAECTFVPGGINYGFAMNIIGEDPSCPLAVENDVNENRTVDPSTVFTSLIGPLASNGGPTATHALLPGSLALDAIEVAVCNASSNTTDQRGEPSVADGDGDGTVRCDIGSYEQQTPLQGPVATLAGLTPASATAGAAGVTLTINGGRFSGASVGYWNGSPRTTWVHSPTRMSVTIPASDLAGVADLRTAMVTVVNPAAGASNALPFTIVGSAVAAYQTQIVPPGTSSSISQLPTAAGQAGVSATMTNNTAASSAAVVTVATYSSNPVGGTIFAAGGLFDVQVVGADASDSIAIRYYYPSTVTAGAEASLQLQYWTGVGWMPVIGSGGAPPVKNTADNLDGTISGGRVTVTLDATSTPTIMSIGGTIFALAPMTDIDPPTTTATIDPPPNARGWNKSVVNVTLTAVDAGSAVAGIDFSLDGAGWQGYRGPIRIGSEGVHTLRYRARDASGNVEPERVLTVRIDKTDPLAAAIARPLLVWPVNRQLVDVDVSVVMKDFLSGTDGFKLVSVVSSDPAPAGDIVGWTVGTADTKGQLRAARTAFGRLYVLTYEVADRAGNTTHAVAIVLVPPWR
jgi:uncharacterized repeat protein (TIGR01451 family)